MYDKREPFQVAQKALTFTFSPNRYETWTSGKLIDKGNINGKMQCIPSILSQAQSEVKFFDFPENLSIRHTLLFDMTFTSGDRIYLATVPKETNINNYNNFQSFKSNVPIGFQIETREKRDFDENEPFVCSVFTINNRIAKVSFSFGNVPRLIELYDDSQSNSQDNQKVGLKMAYKLVESLIEEWDDGDARIGEESFLFDLKTEFPEVNSNEDTIQELIIFINSIVPGQKAITRFQNEFMMRKSWVLMTEFRKSDLYYVLNKIKEIM